MTVVAFVIGLVCGVIAAWLAFRSNLRMRADAQREEDLTRDAEATERMSELASFSGGLAHEIRNPLSTLKVNFQLLAEDWQEAANAAESDLCRRSLAKIEVLGDETDRLQVILDDFLHYMGKQELQSIRADVNELVDDLLVFFRPQATARHVQVLMSIWSEPLICEMDVAKIKQALLNLFVNAQQAMPDGGELMVRTSMVPDPDDAGLPRDGADRAEGADGTRFAQIEVVDTGRGIPDEELEKVFQPYFSTKREGTGLGLPTTRRIIRAHAGEIEVHSEPGRGTRFTVRLPLATNEK